MLRAIKGAIIIALLRLFFYPTLFSIHFIIPIDVRFTLTHTLSFFRYYFFHHPRMGFRHPLFIYSFIYVIYKDTFIYVCICRSLLYGYYVFILAYFL